MEEVRGFEEDCFVLLQKTFIAFPRVAEITAKLQNYAEQNFVDSLDFSRQLSQAKDIPDFVRINVEFAHKSFTSIVEQAKDFAEACTGSAARAIRSAYNLPS